MPKFKVLPGLPPIGPMPVQFSASGRGQHREGFVVEFGDESKAVWVGNFQRGGTRFDTVVSHPDGNHVLVVAGGTAYVVDPGTRRCIGSFGVILAEVIEAANLGVLILASWTHVLALSADGIAWRTGRVSLDGIRNLRVEGDKLVGQGWWGEALDSWSRFEVDLASGKVTGRFLKDD